VAAVGDADKSINWRGYAAWGSFLCGSVGLVLTVAIGLYIDYAQRRPFDRWEALYLLATTSVSLIGIILGAIGKETPRIAGLVMSTLILLVVPGAAVAQ
jgi:hypothetical protein